VTERWFPQRGSPSMQISGKRFLRFIACGTMEIQTYEVTGIGKVYSGRGSLADVH